MPDITEEKRVIVDVRDVSFRYGEAVILENVSFTIREGEYLGVLGPNGGGKTTLLKILLGLLVPTTGTVTVFGQSPVSLREKSRIGYVPQRVAHVDVSFPATVQEIVASGRTARVGPLRRFQHHDVDAIDRAMRIADVHHTQNRLIGSLSGGERQRVFIARALAGEPTILILDEPTVGVDVASQEKFYAFLEDLNQKHGITIVFVTHDIDVIAREAHSVLCLNHGLICHGSPKDFIKEEIMEKLYGRKVQFVLHGHDAPA